MIYQSARLSQAADERIRRMPLAVDTLRRSHVGDWVVGLIVTVVFVAAVAL